MERKKNTKEIASEYRMTQWAGIMRERATSGLSIVKYCAREGMPTNRYHYWQRRLRAAAAKELLPEKVDMDASVPTGWTQVTSSEDKSTPNSSSHSGVSIEIGKCRVGVEKTADMELLTKVCGRPPHAYTNNKVIR